MIVLYDHGGRVSFDFMRMHPKFSFACVCLIGVCVFHSKEGCCLQGRLEPGRMLLVDTEKKVVINDQELKLHIACGYPLKAWLKNLVRSFHYQING